MSFNFGKIADVISSIMDSDFIDIKRDMDGSLQEVYTNIQCHIEYNATDNPDPTTVDIKPIIQSITLHLPLWVDIRNNDYIIAKKCDNNHNIIGVYGGRCGNPIVYQSRKEVLMQMSSTGGDVPTPTPPVEGVKIVIRYESNGESIQNEFVDMVLPNSTYVVNSPNIDGYSLSNIIVDQEEYVGESVVIEDVGTEDHLIVFEYLVSSEIKYFRHLVNGLYTKDDGTLMTGYHLYKKVAIDSIVSEDDVYTIVSDDVSFIHADNFKTLNISVGTKIVAGDLFLKIVKIDDRTAGKVQFECEEFIPTESESNAYECDWYG